MKKRYLALLGACALALPVAASAQYEPYVFWKSVVTPADPATIGIIRLAADSTGKVYLSRSTAPSNMEIHYSTDILTAAEADTDPTYTLLLTDNAMANGFQGLVVDASDNFYVAGESGTAGTGTLRKYDSSGNLDTNFGTAGLVTPTARLTGLDILSNGTLIATTFGGNLFTFDPVTGAETDAANANPAGNFVRDIAVKQDTVSGNDVIYATQNGSLIKITGGSATNVTGYDTVATLVTRTDTTFQVRPAVHYSEATNEIIFGNHTDNEFDVVDGTTEDVEQTLTQATADPSNYFQPGDAVVISEVDYDYLITNSALGVLSIYRRDKTNSVADWTVID